jgi:hypothetical protein
MRRVRVLVFRVNGDRIAAGDGLKSGTVTAPFLLVRQTNEREANQGGALARVFQRVDIADVALSSPASIVAISARILFRCRPARSLRERAASRSGSPAP